MGSKPQSVPSLGYEFLRELHNACAVASLDGKHLCIMEANHEGRHGWEARDQHSEQVATVMTALDTLRHLAAGHKHWSMSELRTRAIEGAAALDSLEEQLEAVEKERDYFRDRLPDFSRVQQQEFARAEAAMDCMNYAWTIICNVSEGDWSKQRQEWQDAASKCRDQYHALLDSNPASVQNTGTKP